MCKAITDMCEKAMRGGEMKGRSAKEEDGREQGRRR